MLHECLQARAEPTFGNALGRNISTTLQDVEVLAVALREVPTTIDRFDALRGSKEWVNVQFAVLGVGPPGWLKAPFQSSQPKKKDPEARALYEAVKIGDSERTVFYPFEKGRTGKDRGKRVVTMPNPTEPAEEINVSAWLEPGMVISTFLRNENDMFGSDRIVGPAAEESIAGKSFVFLQVGVTNAEQALAGRLLKVKKVKCAPSSMNASCILACVNELTDGPTPDALQQHALSNIVMKDQRHRLQRLEPTTKGYASWNGDDIQLEGFWNGGGIKLTHEEAMRATGTSDPERACKLINLATAMGAVRVLVHSNDMVQEGAPDTALFMHIDVNRMLLLDKLESYDAYDSMLNSDFAVQVDSDKIQWCSAEGVLQGDKVVFQVQRDMQALSKPWNLCSESSFISDGCPGPHYALKVYRTRASLETCLQPESLKQLIMTLQLRPVAAGAGDKRKRPALLADSRDECEYEE